MASGRRLSSSAAGRMKTPILVLGLVAVLCIGCGRAHPIEAKISAQFINALRNEIREMEFLSKAPIPVVFVGDTRPFNSSNTDIDEFSDERAPCINLGNDGCVNGAIVGAGGDGEFLGGEGNPGK